MSIPKSTRCHIIREKPEKEIGPDTFELTTRDLEEVTGSKVLVRVDYLSNDPAQRTWIQRGADPERAYAPVPSEGDIMPAQGLGEVLAVGPDVEGLAVGDAVLGGFGWSAHRVLDASAVRPATRVPGMSPTIALGALGSTGLTAYYGLLEVGKADEGDACVVVSGAAGATGSMVVQIAKGVLGVAKVIGLAGGPEKCAFVESLGADACIDYKSATWREDLRRLTERKIDLYFDNVGAEILDECFLNMKRHGRIVQCGMISSYHDMDSGVTFKNYFEVVINRLSILGFIVLDALPKAPEYIGKLVGWIKEGKIKIVEGKSETVKEAKLEDVPQTWQLLYTGGNSGKLITKLLH